MLKTENPNKTPALEFIAHLMGSRGRKLEGHERDNTLTLLSLTTADSSFFNRFYWTEVYQIGDLRYCATFNNDWGDQDPYLEVYYE